MCEQTTQTYTATNSIQKKSFIITKQLQNRKNLKTFAKMKSLGFSLHALFDKMYQQNKLADGDVADLDRIKLCLDNVVDTL